MLINNLSVNGYDKNNNIIIAGHQYCDEAYNGISDDCDPTYFNETLYKKWIKNINTILGDNFVWMMTEGNVKCNDGCRNGYLYTDFLKYILSQSNCIGFTLWMSAYGDDYKGQNIGPNSKNKPVSTYTSIYTTTDDGTHYVFKDQFIGE